MAPLDPIMVNACKVISLMAFAASIAWFVTVKRREAAAAANRKSTAMPTRPVPPLPRAATPAGSSTTKVAAASVNPGLAAHQQRALAKTAKLPPATPAAPVAPPKAIPAAKPVDDDEAMNTLFAGVAKTAPTPAEDAERKVSRLQELGFHHSISPSDPKAASANPVAPRTNTAELNSILERIDQFLADEPKDTAKPTVPVAAPAAAHKPSDAVDTQAKTEPMVATKAAETKPEQQKTTPLWARPDAVDEDVTASDKPAEGEQQRLF